MGFSQALSGLNAATSNLNVVSNNIANAQTVGFKSSSAQFADVYAGAKVGLGVEVASVLQNFSDGTLETTNRNLDLAISGGGFFRFQQDGQIAYSRNGQLTMTTDGYLRNAQGGLLTGYPAGAGVGGQPQLLQVPAGGLQAQATTDVAATMNLDTTMPVLSADAFDATDPSTYSYASSATAYDSQGNSHSLTLYFTKTGSNQWNVRVAQNGVIPEDQVPQQLSFDSNGLLNGNVNGELDASGQQVPYEAGSFTFALDNGAADLSFKLDLAGTTQFANEFELGSLKQDGYSSGSLVGISIDESGQVIGKYSNEQTNVLGTIALANFRNPEGLKPIGGNSWVETGSSGQPLMGGAGVGQFGSIQAGVVENSNVDLTKELVALIIAQRNFQASAQTIKSQDEVLQQAVNLR